MGVRHPNSPSPAATELALRFARELRDGLAPRIEDAIALAPPAEWEMILHSLLTVEINARRQQGESPTLKEYAARFPNDLPILQALLGSPTENNEPTRVGGAKQVPIAQFLAPVMQHETLPPTIEAVPAVAPAESHLVRGQPDVPASNRPVWLFLGGGALLAVVACIAVILAILPPQPPNDGTTNTPNETPTTPTPKAKDDPYKSMTDPERATAEWVLRVGGRGALQTSRGRMSLARDVDLPKGSFVLEALILPAAAATRWSEPDLQQFRLRDKISHLELTHPNALTEAALQNFAKHPLRILELRGPDIGATGAWLAGFPQLERLTLLNAPNFGDSDMTEVGKLDRLTTLKISSPKITAAGFRPLTKLPFLRALTLGEDCTLTQEHIRQIQTIPLEEFISLGGLTDDVFAECAVFVDLKRCALYQTSIGNAGFKAVGAMRRLEELRVIGSTVSSDGFKAVLDLKSLRVLELRGARLTDEALMDIDQLPALKELRLSGAPLSDRATDRIANCDGLEVLDLSDSKITDRSLQTLTKHPTLKTLIIQRTAVSQRGVQGFQTSTPKCSVLWK